MNTRTGTGANSDYWTIFMKFIGSLWGSQSTLLMGYTGGVVAFLMPMFGIIYFQTKAFTNLATQLQQYQLTNVAYNAFLSTIFASLLAALTVYTSVSLFTTFVMTVADAKEKKQVVFAETGLIILGKGILYGTTAYLVCQVLADRIFVIWGDLTSANLNPTNGDFMQKIKGIFDSSLSATEQVTNGLELVTFLLTPVALYSVLGLIVGGVSTIIS